MRISLRVIISRFIDELRKFLWCNQFETTQRMRQRKPNEFLALGASELTGPGRLDSDAKDRLQTHTSQAE